MSTKRGPSEDAKPAVRGRLTLSHLDRRGEASMVDVSAKQSTVRRALAEGRILMSGAAFTAVRDSQLAKGDVLGTARIAGVMAGQEMPEAVRPMVEEGARREDLRRTRRLWSDLRRP